MLSFNWLPGWFGVCVFIAPVANRQNWRGIKWSRNLHVHYLMVWEGNTCARLGKHAPLALYKKYFITTWWWDHLCRVNLSGMYPGFKKQMFILIMMFIFTQPPGVFRTEETPVILHIFGLNLMTGMGTPAPEGILIIVWGNSWARRYQLESLNSNNYFAFMFCIAKILNSCGRFA